MWISIWRGNIEVEQTGAITEDRTDYLPEALRALTSIRKLLKKERTIPQESSDAGPPRKTTIVEEHGSLVIAPLSDILPS